MKRKFKIGLLSLLSISFCIVFYGISSASSDHDAKSSITILEAHGDYISYKSIDELEAAATVVVEAKFTGNRETKHFKNNDVIIDSVSKSEVQIIRTLKGTPRSTKITVYEPGYFPSVNVYTPTEGYNIMNNNGKYILYLRENKIDETYVIVGGYQGKFDLTIDGVGKSKNIMEKDYIGDNEENFLELKKQVYNKYN